MKNVWKMHTMGKRILASFLLMTMLFDTVTANAMTYDGIEEISSEMIESINDSKVVEDESQSVKQTESIELMETVELTEREREIVRLVLAGLSNREIGEQLYIAESTVKKHMSHIYEKLEVKNREQLKQKLQ